MVNDELPKGWVEVALQDVASWGSGGTPSRKNPSYFGGDIPWIKTGELDSGLILQTEEHLTREGLKNSSAKVFPKGSVAVAMYGATIGKASILGIDAATNQACAVAIPDQRLTTSLFLFHYLRSQKEAFIQVGKGGAQPNISQGLIKEWPLPLAPLAEQKRIADKLEAVLGRVDACRARLDRVPDFLKHFRQSILTAATSGQLTEEWRENSGAAKPEWKSTDFESACEDITVGFVGKMADAYCESGVPFLRSLNVRPFRFDSRDLKYVSPEFHKSIYKSVLRPGDVVVVRTGAPGQCCVIPPELKEANCSDLVIVRCGSKLVPKFAVIFINSETSQDFVKSERVGVAQAHFNVGSMKRAPLQLPPVPEQKEIVRRVEALFAFADRIEARVSATRAQVDRLTPATLAKAFRGELVPQDPNDEPASALLERLRAERTLPTTTPKPRKTQAPKRPRAPKDKAAMTKSRFDEDVKGQPYLANLLRTSSKPLNAEDLFKGSELPLVDFYKQLAWEVEQGLIHDDKTKLEAA